MTVRAGFIEKWATIIIILAKRYSNFSKLNTHNFKSNVTSAQENQIGD